MSVAWEFVSEIALALLTTMSIPPNVAAALSSAARTCASSRTSTVKGSALPPAFSISCAAEWIVPGSFGLGSAVLAAMATFAPSRAALSPIASPMPRDAPVMNSVLPERVVAIGAIPQLSINNSWRLQARRASARIFMPRSGRDRVDIIDAACFRPAPRPHQTIRSPPALSNRWTAPSRKSTPMASPSRSVKFLSALTVTVSSRMRQVTREWSPINSLA